MANLPIVLIHGYASEGRTDGTLMPTPSSAAALYGTLPQRLEDMGLVVVPINLARYISLDDGIDVDDISLAMDRALRSDEHKHLLESGFNVIIHSTGALVVRNWVRRHWTDVKKCPVARIVHLAGANLGSGWAHLGKTQIVRFGSELFTGLQRGVAVLKALELGSSWSIDLHSHFLQNGTRMFEDYGVMEFCIIGSQTPPEYGILPFRYGKEDGADGVVRAAASNLNFQYIKVAPSKIGSQVNWADARRYTSLLANQGLGARLYNVGPNDPKFDRIFGTGYYEVTFDSKPGLVTGGSEAKRTKRSQVPFAIPYNISHGDKKLETGIVSGLNSAVEVDPLIKQALETTEAAYPALVGTWEGVTQETRRRAAEPQHKTGFLAGLIGFVKEIFEEPRAQYDGHAQLVFRLRDQHGNPINDFNIYFNSLGGDQRPTKLINNLFEDKHKNDHTPNTIAFYLRVLKFEGDGFRSALDDLGGVDLEIDARDPNTDRIIYLPLRMRIPKDEIIKWICADSTTILDVVLFRVPSENTFVIRRKP